MPKRGICQRYQISLSPIISRMLEKLVESKGLTRSSVIAVAIEKYFREQKLERSEQ